LNRSVLAVKKIHDNSEKLEEASAHKSAKTHAGDFFVTRDLDLCRFDSKINGFPGIIVEHFCVKFGCIGF